MPQKVWGKHTYILVESFKVDFLNLITYLVKYIKNHRPTLFDALRSIDFLVLRLSFNNFGFLSFFFPLITPLSPLCHPSVTFHLPMESEPIRIKNPLSLSFLILAEIVFSLTFIFSLNMARVVDSFSLINSIILF